MTVRVRLAALGAVFALLWPSAVVGAAPSRSSTTTAPPRTAGEATERKQDVDRKIRTLREQVEEASAEETDLLGRLDDIASRRRQLDARLRELDVRIGAVEAELAAATAELQGVEGDLRRASAKLADTEAGLGRAREALVERAIEAYMREPAARTASVMLEGRAELRDVAAAHTALRAQVDRQRQAVRQYTDLRERLENEQVGLTLAREQYAAQQAVVSGAREKLVAARSEQAEVRRQVAADEAHEKKLLADVRERVKEFEGQLAALKKESDSIAAFLRARQTGKPIAPGSGVLGRPVSGPITSGFGPRRHPVLGTVRNHTGIDFGSPSGTPIKSAGAGVVVWAGERGGYGTVVIVDHGGSLATLYAHQSRTAVRDGATVARGDTLGYVGSTGLSTGPHLHFEVRVSGNPVDPLRYL